VRITRAAPPALRPFVKTLWAVDGSPGADAAGTARELVLLERAIALARQAPRSTLAEIAMDAGYSDEAHLTREFRELAGVTAAAYRRLALVSPHHVPYATGGQISSRQLGSAPATLTGKGAPPDDHP